MKLTAEQRKATLASKTQADAARIISVGGKGYRDTTRNAFGVHVSRDGVWDDRLRLFRGVAYVEAETPEQRKAIVAAYKNGDATPPKF